jgi:hypothetical protein
MAARTVSTHDDRTCTVEVTPSEVDAGAELTVTVRASCPHGCDLTGQNVLICERDNTELACAELAALDDGTFGTALTLRAPLEVGEHVCRAVLAAQEKDGVRHTKSTTAFSFVAIPHAASVSVWGLVSAIAAGERFSFKVGIKCSAGCRLAGRALSVTDSDGAQVAAAKLGDDVWPGTSALYFAEVEAQAPRTPGDFIWRVTSLASASTASEQNVPHAAGLCEFAVRIVAPPDHEVTVEAFDSDTQTPIKGAHVLLHPYRALTDERGMAKVKVTKGRYTLYVSGFNYIGHERIIDVTSDVTARAELAVEPEEDVDIR